MGKDKTNILFRGRKLILRIVERLAGLQGEMLIIGLEIKDGIDPNIRILRDIYPNNGPLGGLHTALQEASNPLVACIACDMPFANPDLLSYQLDLLLADNLDVVAPSTENGIEPLHGVYRRQTCLPVVTKALKAGDKRLVSWFQNVRLRILTPKEISNFDMNGRAFLNINTPEELRQAEAFKEELLA